MGIKTMPRLKGFDYKRPYFYMVTLKALPGIAPFSKIVTAAEPPCDAKGRPKFLELTAFTLPFAKVVRELSSRFRGLAPIETFMIMPDHLHILFKIEDSGDQLALGKYVYQLEKALAREYWRIVADGTATDTTRTISPIGTVLANPAAEDGERCQSPVGAAPSDQIPDSKPAPIFAPDWHDWIVKKKGQLAAFTRYKGNQRASFNDAEFAGMGGFNWGMCSIGRRLCRHFDIHEPVGEGLRRVDC